MIQSTVVRFWRGGNFTLIYGDSYIILMKGGMGGKISAMEARGGAMAL